MDPIVDHLASLTAERYSPAMLTARRRLLLTLPDPLNLDRPTMLAWWESRQTTVTGRQRAASSLAGECSHLRAYFRWAIRQGLIDRNPADWLPSVRQSSRLADPIREGDLLRAMKAADEPMRRMLALGAMAGLRSAEIACVTWEDIDVDAGVLWVRQGKGRKDRSVPLSSGLLAGLGDPGEGIIIGKAMTPKAVSMAIGRHLSALGTGWTAHKLRARYATRFHDATGDLAATARVLGHASVATSQKYVLASTDTMRAGAEACGRIG